MSILILKVYGIFESVLNRNLRYPLVQNQAMAQFGHFRELLIWLKERL